MSLLYFEIITVLAIMVVKDEICVMEEVQKLIPENKGWSRP